MCVFAGTPSLGPPRAGNRERHSELPTRLRMSPMLCIILEWALGQWTINSIIEESWPSLCGCVRRPEPLRSSGTSTLGGSAPGEGQGRALSPRGAGLGAWRSAQGAAETGRWCEQDFLKRTNDSMRRGLLQHMCVSACTCARAHTPTHTHPAERIHACAFPLHQHRTPLPCPRLSGRESSRHGPGAPLNVQCLCLKIKNGFKNIPSDLPQPRNEGEPMAALEPWPGLRCPRGSPERPFVLSWFERGSTRGCTWHLPPGGAPVLRASPLPPPGFLLLCWDR